MSKRLFKSAAHLQGCIDAYFFDIAGEHGSEIEFIKKPGLKPAEQQVREREPEPATISGLALFLGFSSRQAFESYGQDGKYAEVLKRGRLRIEASYEKKLHQQSPSAAIFALKSMGWNEKTDTKPAMNNTFNTIKIEIQETGPKPASNEKEVVL